jgi:hypothetical protein
MRPQPAKAMTQARKSQTAIAISESGRHPGLLLAVRATAASVSHSAGKRLSSLSPTEEPPHRGHRRIPRLKSWRTLSS